MMEELNVCPVCQQRNFKEFLKCTDHFLSGEEFKLDQCPDCGLIFTNPRPEADKLGAYYQSEEYISHSNTKKGIVNKVYHFIRKRNHKKKFQLIQKHKMKGRILDIGCASGEFLMFFKEKGWSVFGIEPDENTRQFARENYQLEVGEEKDLRNLKDQSFDVITLWHVLEHVPMLHERMKELKRLLAPDGILIIAVPNADSFDAKKYEKFWAAWDVPRHLYHFNQNSANTLFKQFGFYCQEIHPMKFDSYYVSMLSEKYLKSKNRLWKAYNTGRKSNHYAKKHNKDYSSLIYLLKSQKTDL